LALASRRKNNHQDFVQRRENAAFACQGSLSSGRRGYRFDNVISNVRGLFSMIVEFALFCSLACAAAILLVKLYQRRQDVLHGPYISRDGDAVERQGF
jgi:hypothetical protein